ncbi:MULTISPECIES: 4-hydroxy-3-methylbut-2-enyl diphosphate reductase [unclassified Microcoleus]|uniref:4-hydroxy-3-methylbut-2-enyl diphosphate reductase n=1 Tax=unclassified Microcoleus TaxID=2642155 RepID=UPI001DE7A832|nr:MULTISPECIES: 4-hydroxy-3-methylbut-2-enyl diphosphate reductase [unclassified Microcoleus]TAE09001.1 MAG: 4-hydroxy-3-methylbut-2-enyl diphosphate reductase [Oscillatoriales cyanobacterium]MCC3435206.1 4-hydroxy-3-methylbut-2-enyl diphosphate reductase [Microcoleus sp. PH2017_05_CCC_O_A]MCC3474871.1 4-hydroxy-3-methylbut-2-enyl diphosphate reductase [Microcoleus sp. PH2017_13_LAR_U_A]MCC3487368.1 4-hydroxy-3-methylbut-2-enyl diphosphate reductase [Microcoleus sp. PH2017_14_LAR_D_A]MCC35838
MDTKAFKRSLQQSENYHRKGFGHEAEVAGVMETAYQSSLIQQIRDNNYRLQRGAVTIRLAEAFGFCWGVERAVAIAYETRQHFPSERIWITNEIIHNPSVNQHLRDMEVGFIAVEKGQKDFSVVDSGDVVILPAFGASVQEMQLLNDRGCKIVDTTCPWVSKVWNTVEKHKKRDYTSIIHGQYKHEETVATSSFADKYLIVLNLQEAEYVSNYILHGGDRAEFLAKFSKAYSAGFDPDVDLVSVGIANQTTMLKTETENIGKLFEKTMMRKFGPSNLNEHFLSFNTICDATQERQDAMLSLVEEKLDLMLVIGGFNSSNTTHLQEIAIDKTLPSYHIDSAERILPGNRIEHKPLGGDLVVTENWLPEGNIVVGVTSGASTPDKVVEDAIDRILAMKAAVIP